MGGGADPKHLGSFKSAWRHRKFRYLLGSFAVSGSGDFVYAVALVAYVLNRTGSAAWVGGAIAFRLLPAVVFGPLAGVMASRFDRRRLMITLDLVRAVVMGALSVAAGLNHRYGSA